uniref:Uncharacterized protein n=1 Tax=Brassica campestris TaxID=3711 RepID=A0A3P6ABX5_BRACM|nr:unnamed protein product [Brassica rapa]
MVDINVRLLESTSFEDLTEPISGLNKVSGSLFDLANTNTHLQDITGGIIGVQSTVSDPPE